MSSHLTRSLSLVVGPLRWAWLALVAAGLVLALLVAAAPAGFLRSPAAAAEDDELGYRMIRTIAGTGEVGFSGDGGPATEAELDDPFDVAVDDAGNVYIAAGERVRKVDSDGVITTVAGGGDRFAERDSEEAIGHPATEADLNELHGVAVDNNGNVHFANGSGTRVYKIDDEGVLRLAAGSGSYFPDPDQEDGGPATEASIFDAESLTFDDDGNLYIGQTGTRYSSIRKVGTDGIITTHAGNGDRCGTREYPDCGDGGPATKAKIAPSDVAADSEGNVYVSNSLRVPVVRMIDADGIIDTVAGTGERGHSGDGGPATEADLNYTLGLATDADDNLYIISRGASSSSIRKVDSDGLITTEVGHPDREWESRGYKGEEKEEGVPPLEASTDPLGLAVHERIGPDDGLGLFIADWGNARVRRVDVVPDLLDVNIADETDAVNTDQELVYELEVTNHGLAGTATGVVLTSELADEVEFQAADASQGNCSETDGSVSCELGEIAPGDVVTLEIAVDPTTAGVVVENNVSVEANEEDPFPLTNTARTATPIGDAGCNEPITEDLVLDDDLGPCPQNGIVVDGDDITVDLNGHHVTGFREFDETDIETYDFLGTSREAGVQVTDQNGVTVENGTVSGFSGGTLLDGGGQHTVRELTVRDNIGFDEGFIGDGSVIENPAMGDGVFIRDSVENRIVDNDIVGNGYYTGIAVLGFEAHDNTIMRNTVTDTIGLPSGPVSGQGIMLNATGLGGFEGTLIRGNDIKQNTVRDNASAGMSIINSKEGEILDNTIEGNGVTHRAGNGIGMVPGFGVDTNVFDYTIQGNEIHENAENGIHLRGHAWSDGPQEVRVLNNNVSGSGALDLLDDSPECGDNVWRNNTWSESGFDPECTTRGGNGPWVHGNAPDASWDPADFARVSEPEDEEGSEGG